MGVFNKIHATIACPRCGVIDFVEIELRLGNAANMLDLRIGDAYPWTPDQPPEAGGRPEHGDADGDGYLECKHCHRDSFLVVTIRGDLILGVESNRAKAPHIKD